MSAMKLSSPRQVEDAIARLFIGGQPVSVEALEAVAFNDSNHLALGHIELVSFSASRADLKASVREGSFAWTVPAQAEVEAALRTLLELPVPAAGQRLDKAAQRLEVKLGTALEAIARIAARVGLIRPIFDAQLVAELPFRRPATIVADTSGVLQGALDFVATYLQPMARIKVPAVLHMEVVNQADRFLSTRRRGAKRVDQLTEHLQSQTGQRALLRLELREDTEVERNLLLGDPLRSAFREDRDPDLQDLNLNVPLRSYVDRMILEAARQHQFHAAPGHQVYVLTADQGLARMALAEGVPPIFFRAVGPSQFFGRRLTGALFHPFTGELVGHPLANLVWELATAFGRARLRAPNGAQIDVIAVDPDLPWSAYHSRDDLLWFTASDLPDWPAAAPRGGDSTNPDDRAEWPSSESGDGGGDQSAEPQTSSRTDKAPPKRQSADAAKPAARSRPRLAESNRGGVPFYRVSPLKLVTLVDALGEVPRLSDSQVAETLDIAHAGTRAEYRRFLASGEFIAPNSADWVAEEPLVELARAQQECDLARMDELLRRTPSYRALVETLEAAGVSQVVTLPFPPRVVPSYSALAEVVGLGAPIPEEGFYATLERPSLPTFVDIALREFATLSAGERWVSVGLWLEAMIRNGGIHPVLARDRLREASASGILRMATEGSTTDTRHDDHSIRVLKVNNGRPRVDVVHLYRGDFLSPDKSSTSLHLEAGGHP